jgi:uncharacterized membrane protein YGL010W
MTVRETLLVVGVLGMMAGVGMGFAGAVVSAFFSTREPTTLDAVATLIAGLFVFASSLWFLGRVQKAKTDLFARTDADRQGR